MLIIQSVTGHKFWFTDKIPGNIMHVAVRKGLFCYNLYILKPALHKKCRLGGEHPPA